MEQPVDLEMHPSGIVPQLQNVVCTVNLGTKLELKEIALQARNAEYNPKRFAAVIMRIREPKTTALIFSSGKMVCTGAKSEEDARTAARKFAKIVQKLGFAATFREFKIQNIVGSCDVKFPIRLEGMHSSHQQFANYEPELFPGLVYRMVVPKVVLLVFVSGKVVLTGAKQRADIYTAFENIYPILQNFRKGTEAQPPVASTPQMLLALTPVAATPLVHLAPALGTAGPSGLYATLAQHQDGGEGPMAPPSPRRLPPPTPVHNAMLPPPSPAHLGLLGTMMSQVDLPPPTPAHH